MGLTDSTRLIRELRLRRIGDLSYRAYYAALNRTGILQRRFPAAPPRESDFVAALRPGGPAGMEEFVKHFDSRRPTFYFDHQDLDETVAEAAKAFGHRGERPKFLANSATAASAFGSANSPVIEAANQILERRFSALGSSPVQFNGRVDWLHCLNHDARWPADHHWSRVNFRRARDCGDVKTCWEWNRHHAFVTLGRAWRQTGDKRYVEEFVRLLNSWCDQNPPEMGVNYVSNLEIGLRSVSWLWAHHLMAPSEDYPDWCRARLHLFLYYMARHLAGNLDYTLHTGRNNHLIGDISCLAVWCLMYPEVEASSGWLERGLPLLWKAVDDQVYPDGMHYELSFGYQQFVMELVLQVVLLLRRNERPVPQSVLARLEKMTEVLAAVVQPNGEAPNFNDDDDGFVWALHDWPRERLTSLLEIGAVLFDRPELVPAYGDGDGATTQTRLLLGLTNPEPTALAAARQSSRQTGVRGDIGQPSGRKTVAEAAKAFGHRGERSKFLANSATTPSAYRSGNVASPLVMSADCAGLYVVRAAGDAGAHFALLNNHPDPFPDSGHNHASLLQLLLWIDGKPLLIDGGTYRYTDQEGWRNTLRGTRAHNTVVVDGFDQAEPCRNFGWASKLRPGKSQFYETDEFVVFDGFHDSYRRLFHPVRHRRSVIWIKQYGAWIVRDQLTGKGTHSFQQMWHLPGEYHLSQRATGLLEVDCNDGVRARIQLLTEPTDRVDIVCGDPHRLWSWESPSYGTLRPRHSIALDWTAAVPTSRVAGFFPLRPCGGDQPFISRLGSNRLSVGDGLFEFEFDSASIRCWKKGARCAHL